MEKLSKTDGMPVLTVSHTSLLGTWCAYSPLSIGYLATDEFTFSSDRRFVWRELNLSDENNASFRRIEGKWHLEKDLLQLHIESQEIVEGVAEHRVDYAIRMRRNKGERQLVLEPIRYDDEILEKDAGAWLFPVEASPGDADQNLREYTAKRKKKITLEGPYKELITLLTQGIPAAFEARGIQEPLFCVRLVYFDTHAPRENYCCAIRCLTEAARQRVLKEEDPVNIPDRLWHPTLGIAESTPSEASGVIDVDLSSNTKLMAIYAQIYDLLEESEEGNILKLQGALRRVSLILHMVKWPETVTTSDDFVIFPADGSNHFAGEYQEDMKASIPHPRLNLLIQRGYVTT